MHAKRARSLPSAQPPFDTQTIFLHERQQLAHRHHARLGHRRHATEGRTRIGGGWRDGTGVAPLSEDSEAYEVDVLDGADGSVLRTLTGDTNSVTYAAADIVTDFGSAPTDLYVRIVQISAVIGRGFSYQWRLVDGTIGTIVGKAE
jgi:hypothetical protein